MSPDAQHEKRRVFLVDDHPIVRQGLALLINSQLDLIVCGEASSYAEAIQGIEQSKPELVIADIGLDDSNGLDLVKRVAEQMPGVATLVLSMHDESLYAERAIRAGASGYIMKGDPADTILNAIRHVLDGGTHLSERVREKLLRSMVGRGKTNAGEPTDRLSDRELEVFIRIGQGHGTRDIADSLHISVKTVETYRTHIREKLRLEDGGELLRYAIEWARGTDHA